MMVSLAGIVSKLSTLADNTVRVQVDLQEAPASEMANLFALKGSIGWFFFSEKVIDNIDTKDLPEITIEDGEKSPSKRLRSVLYVLWKQLQPDMTSEVFYRVKMEEFIESIKEKLDPL